MPNRRLEIYYKKRHIGTLAEMPDKRIAFQYSDDWVKTGFSINPISLPLKSEVFIPKENSRNIFQGLHGVFADSLPDEWGKLLINNYLTSIGINYRELSVLEKLAYVGNSGIGALEYYPSKTRDFTINSSDINFDEIANECDKILSSKASDKLDLLYKLAGSSGGTRPKILLSEKGEEWIVKFPSRTDSKDSGKREYDYSVCAKKCGIKMTDTRLINSKVCDGYFKTKRFDRDGSEKIFTATFAGLLNVDYNSPSCDYSTYMKLIKFMTKDNKLDKQQMYKHMCFNILAQNKDDHTKNFSFIFTEDYGWRLSPAYDITYSTTYYGEQTTSVNNKGRDISDSDLYAVGIDAGLPKKYVSEELENIKDNIQELDKYIIGTTKKENVKVPVEERIKEVQDNVDTLTSEINNH